MDTVKLIKFAPLVVAEVYVDKFKLTFIQKLVLTSDTSTNNIVKDKLSSEVYEDNRKNFLLNSPLFCYSLCS